MKNQTVVTNQVKFQSLTIFIVKEIIGVVVVVFGLFAIFRVFNFINLMSRFVIFDI